MIDLRISTSADVADSEGCSGVTGVVGVPGIRVVELSTRNRGRDSSECSSALWLAGIAYPLNKINNYLKHASMNE